MQELRRQLVYVVSAIFGVFYFIVDHWLMLVAWLCFAASIYALFAGGK